MLCITAGAYAQDPDLVRRAKNGDANAQDKLGWLYYIGKDGVEKDISQFLYWTKKSVNNGNPGAAFSLGLYYEDFDEEEAIYWFKKCMDMHYAEYGTIRDAPNEELRRLGVIYDPRTSSIEDEDAFELEDLLDFFWLFGL